MTNKIVKPTLYEQKIHTWGRVSLVLALVMFIAYPFLAGLFFGVLPNISLVFRGLLAVAPIFWVVGVIEAFTFGPMLGSGGAYLGFVTGNLTAIKVPAALRAMQVMGVEPNTQEGEAVSTIAIAVSSIVTTLMLVLCMLLISAIQPILLNPVFKPAYDNVLPALFGALGVVFISKNWKIAIAPIALMLAIFLAVPGLASAINLLIPLGAGIAILVARWLYQREKV